MLLQLYSFDSDYSLVVLEEGGGGIREDQILPFFSQTAFYFYYHKMNLFYSFIISKILVYIFNSFFLKNP